MGRRAAGIVGLLAGAAAVAWWRTHTTDQAEAGGLVDAPPDLLTGSLESELQARGLTFDQARGVAAGIFAESLGDPNAINPTSGAYGVGQWLGSRQVALFARYGPRPTLAQQLDFLAWELTGGDHGGAAVLAATTAGETLDAYIRKFMRPGAGTAGDLARGQRYLTG
jgi:hypothetical protein